MRIGILDLLRSGQKQSFVSWPHNNFATRQYAAIMPQAISVWCKELGHKVHYATYYGQKDPRACLPEGLDLVFISAYTQASGLAYALAKMFRREGVVTVLGGPHAKSFPEDSSRFFDVVVKECDRELISEILSSPPVGQIVASGRPMLDYPAVEARIDEIKASAFWRGRPYPASMIPLISSVGCPYTCNFCTDWNNPFVVLSTDQLEADVRYIHENYPTVLIGFHDPNFGVKFDTIVNVLERVPPQTKKKYILESSLSILRPERIERLGRIGCLYIAPAVESWYGYSNKSGVERTASSRTKLDRVVEHFSLIKKHIPGMQCNFIYGLDTDEGHGPVELIMEFMERTPYAWPTINIPAPFGGTPLYDEYLQSGRILTSMPLAFYYAPYLVTTLKNYDPISYYENLMALSALSASKGSFMRRMRSTSGRVRLAFALRTLSERNIHKRYRGILAELKSDRALVKFHEGKSNDLPDYYAQTFDEHLGDYAELITADDRRPVLV